MRTEQGQINQKVAKQEYKRRNREKHRLQAKEHHRRNREKRKIQSKKRYHKNPEKTLAQLKARRAIASGELVKEPCIFCGDVNVHGHHEDYTKPLEVTWLCKSHHQQVHSGKVVLNEQNKLDENKI